MLYVLKFARMKNSSSVSSLCGGIASDQNNRENLCLKDVLLYDSVLPLSSCFLSNCLGQDGYFVILVQQQQKDEKMREGPKNVLYGRTYCADTLQT